MLLSLLVGWRDDCSVKAYAFSIHRVEQEVPGRAKSLPTPYLAAHVSATSTNDACPLGSVRGIVDFGRKAV